MLKLNIGYHKIQWGVLYIFYVSIFLVYILFKKIKNTSTNLTATSVGLSISQSAANNKKTKKKGENTEKR